MSTLEPELARAADEEDLHERRASPPQRLLNAIRAIYQEPFNSDPERFEGLTIEQRERAQRRSLLRVVLMSVLLIVLAIMLPLALAGQIETPFFAVLGLELVLIVVAFIALALGPATNAALLFIFGTFVAEIGFVALNPDGMNLPTYFVLATIAALIFIAGMILPSRFIWFVAALAVIASLGCALALPQSPTLGDTSATLPLALVLLIALQVMSAIISWTVARTARVGVEIALQVSERERELTALKDQFLIDANHELRTPIMALYGNVEMLKLLGDNASGEQRTRMVGRALDSGDAVLRILATVLDAGRLESKAPQLHVRPVELVPLVRTVLETFDPRDVGEGRMKERMNEPRPVTLEIDPAITVIADEVRLRQVFTNLLSNAIKYSEPGTSIIISAKILPRRRQLRFRGRGADAKAVNPELAQISVRDFGLGVPPRDATKLFNRFVRLERDIAGPTRGTGVGLYMCRVLVEAMGGAIWVQSNGVPGEGSIFHFTLPSVEAAPRLIEAQPEGASVGAN